MSVLAITFVSSKTQCMRVRETVHVHVTAPELKLAQSLPSDFIKMHPWVCTARHHKRDVGCCIP